MKNKFCATDVLLINFIVASFIVIGQCYHIWCSQSAYFIVNEKKSQPIFPSTTNVASISIDTPTIRKLSFPTLNSNIVVMLVNMIFLT